jgi:hypothetical protein
MPRSSRFSKECGKSQGKEEIITGARFPYSYDLFHLFQKNGWLNVRLEKSRDALEPVRF